MSCFTKQQSLAIVKQPNILFLCAYYDLYEISLSECCKRMIVSDHHHHSSQKALVIFFLKIISKMILSFTSQSLVAHFRDKIRTSEIKQNKYKTSRTKRHCFLKQLILRFYHSTFSWLSNGSSSIRNCRWSHWRLRFVF